MRARSTWPCLRMLSEEQAALDVAGFYSQGVDGGVGGGPAVLGDEADDVGAAGDCLEVDIAGGVADAGLFARLEDAVVVGVDVDASAGEAGFAGVLLAVLVGVVEDEAGGEGHVGVGEDQA